MQLIAGSISDRMSVSLLSFARKDPATAKKLGQSLMRMRASFAAAYPGETRTRVISNADWDKAGFGHIAAVNEAFGLKGS